LRDVVREVCETASAHFRAVAGAAVERYRHPSASFQSLRLTDGGIEIAGLGDCSLFLRDAAGTLTRHSGLRAGRSGEQSGAKKALTRLGGLNAEGEAHRDAETLASLRAARARQNTEGGVWTLGIHAEAAEHVRIERPDLRLPAVGLLCSDGFADGVDNYGLHSAADLVARAEAERLPALLSEIRQVEREVDPRGLRYPRYKRSDDASAILVKLGE
jgi:hypothetical protein